MPGQTPVQRTRRPLPNLIASLVFLAIAMPAAAQQVPAKPSDVKNMVNQSAQAGASGGELSKPVANSSAVSETKKPAASPMPKPVAKPASGSDASSATKAVAKPVGKPGPEVKPATAAMPKPVGKPGPVSEVTKSKSVSRPVDPANRTPELTTVANPLPEPPKPPSPRPVTAKPVAAPVKPAAPAATPAAFSVAVSRRDPFAPLVNNARGEGIPENLPPGKAGLLINTLRIDGIVNGPGGMIAIVSNPQQRVYFLRDNDRLYDGQVQHIAMEGVSFHQSGKDPFGNPVEREVTKRLSLTPGEQR